jgi:ABC-type lipoprotein release transport system permease subunit
MLQIIKMAYRDLGRNRRRSFFSCLALALGLALLLLMAAFVRGEMEGAMDSTIRLQSGHLQVRSKTYEDGKTSLKWEDMVENPEQVASQIAALEPVELATPRLFANGIVTVGDETSGVSVFGIDPLSSANKPYRDGLVSGEFITADDREGVLIGQALAEKLDLKPGDKINLTVNTSNGEIDEQSFIIRGIYTTQTNAFDIVTVFMPLAKAQAITRTENHASSIFILLKNSQQADEVASALQSASYKVLTWQDMNEMILQFEELASSYMVIFYLIVLAITATVIVNTLVMAVFERTREIGIMTAIGMKGRQVMGMFLAESTLLAVGGVFLGILLGLVVVAYFTKFGFYVGDMGVSGMLIGNTIYTHLVVEDAVTLTILALMVTLIGGLYPAVLAARMEPVDALRSGQ